MSDRTCQSWRCKDSCWGLPECQHPERVPFYEIKLGIAELVENYQASRNASLHRTDWLAWSRFSESLGSAPGRKIARMLHSVKIIALFAALVTIGALIGRHWVG